MAGAFFFIPLNGLERIGGLPIGDLLLLVAALAAGALCLLERRLPPIPLWLWLGITFLALGFLAAEYLSGVEVGDLGLPGELVESEFEPRASATGYFSRLILAVLILPVVASVLAAGWGPIRLLVIAWIAGVTLSCLTVWLDAAFGTGIQVALSSDSEMVTFLTTQASPTRSVGLTNHPNSLALTAVLVFPLAVSFIRDQKTFLRLLPVLGLLSVAVLLSGSRTGLVGLALAIVGSLALIRPFRKAAFGPGWQEAFARAGAVVLVGLVLFGGVLASPGGSGGSGDSGGFGGSDFSAVERLGPGEGSASASNSARSRYFDESLKLIRERPLTGSGIQLIEYTHNVYLQALLAGGLLALTGLLIVLGGFLRLAFRLFNDKQTIPRPVVAALLLSLVIYLVTALLVNQVMDRYVFLGMALIFAASLAPGRRSRPNQSIQS